jgi:hypothetical protein
MIQLLPAIYPLQAPEGPCLKSPAGRAIQSSCRIFDQLWRKSGNVKLEVQHVDFDHPDSLFDFLNLGLNAPSIQGSCSERIVKSANFSLAS